MPGFEDVEAGIVHWPMSVLRLRGENSDRLIDLGEKVLTAWRSYTDEAAFSLCGDRWRAAQHHYADRA